MFDDFELYWSPVKPPWPGCPRTKDGRRWNTYIPGPPPGHDPAAAYLDRRLVVEPANSEARRDDRGD
jgi:hypothetical protein